MTEKGDGEFIAVPNGMADWLSPAVA